LPRGAATISSMTQIVEEVSARLLADPEQLNNVIA